MTPDGKVVHTIDHLRTFNGDWFRAALVAVLREHGADKDLPKPGERRLKGIGASTAEKRFDEARKVLEPQWDPGGPLPPGRDRSLDRQGSGAPPPRAHEETPGKSLGLARGGERGQG